LPCLSPLHLPLRHARPRLRLLGALRLHVPDALRILVDASVAAEEAHARHAGDALADPLVLVLVRLVHQRLRLHVAVEVVRYQVVVAVVLNRPRQRAEGCRVAERALLDLIKDPRQCRVQRVRTVVVCVTEVLNILRQVAEQEDVALSNLASDFNLASPGQHVLLTKEGEKGGGKLTLAPSQVPMIRPPFRTNFMLEVPLASVPAVEMCSLTSLAGIMISALDTL